MDSVQQTICIETFSIFALFYQSILVLSTDQFGQKSVFDK